MLAHISKGNPASIGVVLACAAGFLQLTGCAVVNTAAVDADKTEQNGAAGEALPDGEIILLDPDEEQVDEAGVELFEEEPQQDVTKPPREETPRLVRTEEPEIDGTRHKVWIWQETGDCLWTIAEQYYKDPWQWKRIYLANQDIIENPNVIFPKQVLIIPRDE